jgi:hypothetical protein
MTERAPLVQLTPEEKERVSAIVKEACPIATEFNARFDRDARGFMVFMTVLWTLSNEYSITHKIDSIPTLIAEWVAAGEPKEMEQVPALLLERAKRERGI